MCDDYTREPDIDDTIRFCPECETPNQFGELCERCRQAEYDEEWGAPLDDVMSYER